MHEGRLPGDGCFHFSVVLRYLEGFAPSSFASLRHAKSTISVTAEVASGGRCIMGKSETFRAYVRGRSHSAVFKQKPPMPDPATLLQEMVRDGPLWSLSTKALRLRAMRLAKLRTGMRVSDILSTARERTKFRSAGGRAFLEFALLNPKEQPLASRQAGNFWSPPVRVSAVKQEEICLVAVLREYLRRTGGVPAQTTCCFGTTFAATPWFFALAVHTAVGAQKPASKNVIDEASTSLMRDTGQLVGRAVGGFTPHDWRAMGASKVSVVAHGELDQQMLNLHRWSGLSTFRRTYERPINLLDTAVPPRGHFSDYQDAVQYGYVRPAPEGVAADWLFESAPTEWIGKSVSEGARKGTLQSWSAERRMFVVQWLNGQSSHSFTDVLRWL